MTPSGPGVKAIFTGALGHPPGPGRDAYLAGACGGDATLRRRVEELLAAFERASDVLGPDGASATEVDTDPATEAFEPARWPDTEATDARPDATEADRTTDDASTPAPGDPGATGSFDDRGNGRANGDALAPDTEVRYFGDYQIRRELGRGGMGVVYEARQISLNRPVALKMVRAGLLADDSDLRRFRNEAEAVALLDHTGVVPVYEVGEHRGQHYFSMKLVPGGSLVPLIDRYKDDPKAAARLVAEAAEAVAHAHARGILHRDLKPANILVDDQGHPHVTDFGLAKRVETDVELTQSGAILGTPAYMSPEQASGRRGAVTTASDVYGLGSVLYALLTGRAPFGGDSVVETIDAVRHRPPEPPRKLNAAVPRDMETICLKCLEKDPHRRYATAQALADDLRAWLESRPIAARPVGPLTRAALWCKRRPAVAALSAATVVVTLAGLAFGAWQWSAALSNARIADANAREALAKSLQARASAEAARRSAEEARISTRIAYKTADDLMTYVAAVDLAEVPQMVPVRTLLLDKARTAYERLRGENANRDDPELLWVSAKCQGRLGDILAMLGHFRNAEASYRGAIGRLGSLAGDDPAGARSGRDPVREGLGWEILRDLVRARLGLSVLLKDLYRLDEAKDQLRQAAVSGRAMEGSRDATDRELLADIGYQWGVLLEREAELRSSPLSLESSEIRESERAYREAVRAQTDLVAEAAGPARGGATGRDLVQQRARLARFRNNLGKLLAAVGRYQDAEAEFRRALDQVPVSEGSPGARWQRARTGHNLGTLFLSQPGGAKGPGAKARAAQGQEYIGTARVLLETLRQEFPEVPPYREELAEVYANLGRLEQRRNQHARAIVELRQAEVLADQLVGEFPDVPKHRVQAATVCRRLAVSLGLQHDLAGAKASVLKSSELLTSLVKLFPDLPIYRRYLWESYLTAAYIRLDLGDAEGAARDVEELPRLRPESADSYSLAATLLIRCAEKASPDQRAHRYARATEILREGVDAQKLDRKRLKQPAFVPLRNREDFRRLLPLPADPFTRHG